MKRICLFLAAAIVLVSTPCRAEDTNPPLRLNIDRVVSEIARVNAEQEAQDCYNSVIFTDLKEREKLKLETERPGLFSKTSEKIDGDVGLAMFQSTSIVKGGTDTSTVMPYLFADYGRFFARVDTLGFKTTELGPYGDLEVVTRFNTDGFKTDSPDLQGLAERRNPLPIGVGTLQKTPIGAINVNAFYDPVSTKGAILEATYAAKFDVGSRTTIYPIVGAEYLSRDYVRSLYGISSSEASSRNPAYDPSAGSINPYVGVVATVRPSENKNWHLTFSVKCKRLGSSITGSPIVEDDRHCAGFAGMIYRFD